MSLAGRASAKVGLLKPTELDARVISVGNIQVGGAGKTPLVAQIATEAHGKGLEVCILSRGYRSPWETEGGVISPGTEPADVALCGDEAALLHELSPSAWLGVGADRVKQYESVRQKSARPVDIVILDDGFQHWKIKKNVEIVALTSATSSEMLFRDFPQTLKSADLLVWTKGNVRPDSWGRPMTVVKYHIPQGAPGLPYWLVTGVADGESVRTLASKFGYQIARNLSYPDHMEYDSATVNKILDQAAQNQTGILLTGKDWVKWRALGVPSSRVTVLEPQLVIEEGQDHWSRILWGTNFFFSRAPS